MRISRAVTVCSLISWSVDQQAELEEEKARPEFSMKQQKSTVRYFLQQNGIKQTWILINNALKMYAGNFHTSGKHTQLCRTLQIRYNFNDVYAKFGGFQ